MVRTWMGKTVVDGHYDIERRSYKIRTADGTWYDVGED